MNVSQERIRVHPRAGEAETAVKSGGIPEERVGKKHAPASGRGEGTSADAGESGERERCARALAGAREETREQKRVPRSSSVNFIRNSVRPPLPPFSSPPPHLFDIFNLSFYISPSCLSLPPFCFSIFFRISSFVLFTLTAVA